MEEIIISLKRSLQEDPRRERIFFHGNSLPEKKKNTEDRER